MTNGQSNDDIESRLTRLENVLNSHRESLGLPALSANVKAIDLEALQDVLDTASEELSKFTGVPRRKCSDLDELTQEIDRSAAEMRTFLIAREGCDLRWDDLLKKLADDTDAE